VHVADEAISLAGDRADQALLFAGIADCLADGIDVAGQGGFRDDAATPDDFDQVVLGDHPLAISH
jgi:hypothetical protein